MATIAHPDAGVTGGVDTHKDIHVAAALDSLVLSATLAGDALAS